MDAKKRFLAVLLAIVIMTGAALLAGRLSVPTVPVSVPGEVSGNDVSGEEMSENAGLLATINGVQVDVTDAYNEYQYYSTLYSYYGYGEEDIAQLKQDVADYYVELELIRQQYEKLGLKETLDMETLNNNAAAEYEAAAVEYLAYVDAQNMTEEAALSAARALLNADGYDLAYFQRVLYDQECISGVMKHYQDAVTVTEDDIRAYYDALVAQDQQLVGDDPGYYEVMTGYGERVMYVPEGLRAVKHILVLLSEENEDRVSVLEDELTSIEASLAAEGADTKTLNERKAEIEKELDEIYASLDSTVNEVLGKLDAGEDFISLMEQYGEDPGMTYEPYKTEGYYVHAESTQWVLSFRDAAMALENVGDVSEPVRSSYGIHIIRYEYDVPAGPVAYEEVYDDMKAEASTEAFDEYFDSLLEQWRDESEIEVYMENLDAK